MAELETCENLESVYTSDYIYQAKAKAFVFPFIAPRVLLFVLPFILPFVLTFILPFILTPALLLVIGDSIKYRHKGSINKNFRFRKRKDLHKK